jgi:malate dehydrogenase (oxaloacetate-decarboxylating)
MMVKGIGIDSKPAGCPPQDRARGSPGGGTPGRRGFHSAPLFSYSAGMSLREDALALHRELRGKLSTMPKRHVETARDLSLLYTPGVAEPCREIAKNKALVYDYTQKGNMVAVISDGSAVLGLGNIGPEAGLPVMEGKCVLFREFGGVEAFPLCLDTQAPAAFIQTVVHLAPSFGGINLEDISAPRCFYVEEELRRRLDIPVFHDDQHGTAIVALAALMNAVRIVDKRKEDLRVVISGAGAAGIACARIILDWGVRRLVLCDSKGIVWADRPEINTYKQEIARRAEPDGRRGDLAEALEGADAFIGVSAPGLLDAARVRTMAKDAIIFAMANPEPEIMPEEALAGGARVVATGRSDFPNQINNVLAFPGIFRGALDVRATHINEQMKLAAAGAIAGCVTTAEIASGKIVPSPLEREVGRQVAVATGIAAAETGVARQRLTRDELDAAVRKRF